MTLQVSTRFKERLLGPESFEDIFDGGRIVLYTGSQPTTPDQPTVGTAVGEVSVNGVPWTVGGAGGLIFSRSGAWVSKPLAAVWRLRGLTTGTPTWFRLYGPEEDPGALSYSHPRIDGAMGAEFLLPSYTLLPDTSILVQQFLLTLPPVTGA